MIISLGDTTIDLSLHLPWEAYLILALTYFGMTLAIQYCLWHDYHVLMWILYWTMLLSLPIVVLTL